MLVAIFMQPSLILLCFLSLALFSCMTNDQKQETKTHISVVDTTREIDALQMKLVTKKLSADSDTLIIETKSAIFYQPDSLQIDKRIKEVGEVNFRSGAEDYIYYINTLSEEIEKQGLPVLMLKTKSI